MKKAVKRERRSRHSLRRECEELFQKELELRGKLIIRLVQLGGHVPKEEPDSIYRNLHMYDLIEKLEFQRSQGLASNTAVSKALEEPIARIKKKADAKFPPTDDEPLARTMEREKKATETTVAERGPFDR